LPSSSLMRRRSMHGLGVVCGIAAGAWLGGAEAPAKLVTAGISPFVISLCMVAGVFAGRWTLPAVIKGTGAIARDFRERPHLLVWAVLAGALWVVANTLTVFAIRDVGLSIAFPIWNANTLVGLFWGWYFFQELRGAGRRTWTRVVGGAAAIVLGGVLLASVTASQSASSSHRAAAGIMAALGASVLWGTMYVPYRKAYLSGMNPLSFVTVFTVGEVGTMGTLAAFFVGGASSLSVALKDVHAVAFWLFLGGFCWVVGDLFQQYATKYIGIGRAIPLSNTNQLWGLAWGALVFGELSHLHRQAQGLVLLGSGIMILGALSISAATAPEGEQESCRKAISRECKRYGLSYEMAVSAQHGEGSDGGRLRWWDLLIAVAAIGAFVGLALVAKRPPMRMDDSWAAVLVVAMAAVLAGGAWLLGKRTWFS
jgi:drug/metabolite transporter (DMT)-like permease